MASPFRHHTLFEFGNPESRLDGISDFPLLRGDRPYWEISSSTITFRHWFIAKWQQLSVTNVISGWHSLTIGIVRRKIRLNVRVSRLFNKRTKTLFIVIISNRYWISKPDAMERKQTELYNRTARDLPVSNLKSNAVTVQLSGANANGKRWTKPVVEIPLLNRS